MSQILVLGMHRSGTTLCLDLLRRHPDIVLAINEGVLFERGSGKLVSGPFPNHRVETTTRSEGAAARARESVEPPLDPFASPWIAKMSYPGSVILQEWRDRVDRYQTSWLETFGETARVVHIIRHPFSVFASMRARWGGDPVHLQNYGPISLDAVCREWVYGIEAVEGVESGERRRVILYEDLVEDPGGTISGVLEHCRLESSPGLIEAILHEDLLGFGRVEASRASAHREVSLEPISRSTSWLMTPLFDRFGYRDR